MNTKIDKKEQKKQKEESALKELTMEDVKEAELLDQFDFHIFEQEQMPIPDIEPERNKKFKYFSIYCFAVGLLAVIGARFIV